MTNKLTINSKKLSIVTIAAMTLVLVAALSFSMFVTPNKAGATNIVDYCDPSQKPGGQSIGEWVPKDVNCVEPSVNAVCGTLEGSVNNLTPIGYGISWSEGSPDYNFVTSLPATFPEDYNNGSVEVFYWVVGGEKDYVTGRNIPNFWEQNAASETVNTNCEEEPVVATTTTEEEDFSKPKSDKQEAVAPVGGVNAGGGGGASSTAIGSIFGLLASSAVFGFGLLRGFIRIGG